MEEIGPYDEGLPEMERLFGVSTDVEGMDLEAYIFWRNKSLLDPSHPVQPYFQKN